MWGVVNKLTTLMEFQYVPDCEQDDGYGDLFYVIKCTMHELPRCCGLRFGELKLR
jgi:hypothetical protein